MKKLLSVLLSTLMVLTSFGNTVLAEGNDNEVEIPHDTKPTSLSYEVTSKYEWSVPTSISFTKDNFVDIEADDNDSQVKITKCIIPNEKTLMISTDQSNTFKLVDSIDENHTLDYALSINSAEIGAGEKVLSLNSGESVTDAHADITATLTKEEAEVAGDYGDKVKFVAELVDTMYVEVEEGTTATNVVVSALPFDLKQSLKEELKNDELNDLTDEDIKDAKVLNIDADTPGDVVLDVSQIAEVGETVLIYHKGASGWELVGSGVVDASGKITCTFTDYSPVLVSRQTPSAKVTYVDRTGASVVKSIAGGATITFDAGDYGEYEVQPQNITLEAEVEYDVTGEAYIPVANPGYVFKGFTFDNVNKKFVAYYAMAKYAVTFDNQGHGAEPSTQSLTYGSKVIKPADLTYAGGTFGGWYKEAECLNAWDFKKDKVTEATTLYAKWSIAKMTVNFVANGHGSAPEAQNVDYGSKLSEPKMPVASGYLFEGWNTMASGQGDDFDFDSEVVSNLSLYAKWVDDYSNLSINSQGTASDARMGAISSSKQATLRAELKVDLPEGLSEEDIDNSTIINVVADNAGTVKLDITSAEYTEGNTVFVYHKANSGWELVGQGVVGEDELIECTFSSFSPVMVVNKWPTPGLYDANNNLLCAWEETGIDLENGWLSIQRYEQDSNSAYNVINTKYSATKKVVIPEGTTSIKKWMFYEVKNIETIYIPNTVTSIGSEAFYHCFGLKTVIFEKGSQLTSIGSDAFNSTALTSITIPSSVTSIGGGAFTSTKLTSVTIPEGVTSIGEKVFWSCTNLTSISIPNSVTSIGKSAFNSCTSLQSVTIPEGVTSIGSQAFYNCKNLTSVTIPNSVTSIGDYAFSDVPHIYYYGTATGAPWGAIIMNDRYDDNFAYDDDAKTQIKKFIGTSTEVEIPNTVTSIDASVFYNCKNLTSITIPSSVASIGSSAFYGCTSLTSVTIPNSVTSIGSNAFYNVPLICYNGSASGSPWGAKVKAVVIDNNFAYADDAKTQIIKFIGTATEVEIPNTVTSIDASVFNGCTNLTSVTFEENSQLTSIGSQAFYNCKNLTSITIPSSVASIGSSAFSYVPHIYYSGTATGAPWGATLMNDWYDDNFTYSDAEKTKPIKYIGAAKEVIVPEGTTTIGTSLVQNNTNIEAIVIPSTVTSISNYAFNGCNNLQQVKFANNSQLTTIKDGTFSYGRIQYILIPDSVTTIEGWRTFSSSTNVIYSGSATTGSPWGAKNVYRNYDENFVYSDAEKTKIVLYIGNEDNVTISSSIKEIQNSIFSQNHNIASIKVDSSNTVYDSRDNCNAIIKKTTNELIVGCKNTIIPNSVKSIGNYAFENCVGMTSIDIPEGVTSIGFGAFRNSSLTSVTIPSSVTSIDWYAFEGCSSLTSVTFEANSQLKSISQSAFSGCTNLTSVTIPSSVTSIAYNAFYNVPHIYYSGSATANSPWGAKAIN